MLVERLSVGILRRYFVRRPFWQIRYSMWPSVRRVQVRLLYIMLAFFRAF